jgi:fibronectin type 3 domain-containing protein
MAHGLNGEQLFSHPYYAQLVDSIPPSIPKGLKASVDEFGKVQLEWQPNSDQDIYGYRIYRANFKDEELSQLTSGPVAQNSFSDNVNVKTLNKNVYYSVMAIDKNQNHSVLSEILRVPLPDKIKPQPPVLLPIKSDKNGVTIKWLRSGSTDVTQYDLYRRAAGREEWHRLKIIPATADTTYTYVDDSSEPGKTNAYTVTAIDDSGLESEPAAPVNAGKIGNVIRPAIAWKEPAVERDANRVMLKWAYEPVGVKVYQIYKAINDAPLKLYKTIPGNSQELAEQPMKMGTRYIYRILAHYESGAKSVLSQELVVDY